MKHSGAATSPLSSLSCILTLSGSSPKRRPYPHEERTSGHSRSHRKVFGTIPRDWEEFAIIPEDFFADGDTVIVRGRVRAVAKASGRSMDAPFVHVFTVADGKLLRMTNHHDTTVWEETLGT